MSTKTKNGMRSSELLLHQNAAPIQQFGKVRHALPIALKEEIRQDSVEN